MTGMGKIEANTLRKGTGGCMDSGMDGWMEGVGGCVSRAPPRPARLVMRFCMCNGLALR